MVMYMVRRYTTMHKNQFSSRLKRQLAEDLERLRREGADDRTFRRAIVRRFMEARGTDCRHTT